MHYATILSGYIGKQEDIQRMHTPRNSNIIVRWRGNSVQFRFGFYEGE